MILTILSAIFAILSAILALAAAFSGHVAHALSEHEHAAELADVREDASFAKTIGIINMG